jgi:hypothetical protein
MAKASTPTTNIAVVDIPPPGVAPIQGTFAYRAGDEVNPNWLEQHADYIKSMEDDLGGPVIRRAALADAPQIAQDARGVGSPQP